MKTSVPLVPFSFNASDFHIVALDRLLPLSVLQRLPWSIRLLLENVARRAPDTLPAFLRYVSGAQPPGEVLFYPDRLMFHDTTCLPALADFAAMRDLTAELDGDARKINPRIPAVLTIDHSVIVERYASPDAVEENLRVDFHRNQERYRFIRWAEQSLDNFRVIPPGTGIIHLMNLENIAEVVSTDRRGDVPLLHPDCMIATDSHTPMINALGILGWGVGGLEGQAALVGEPVTLRFPDVVGIRLTGKLSAGVTDSDLALHITRLLRQHGVVGKFVEFTGPALSQMSVESRATIANMAPEYGATVVLFPFDRRSDEYLRLTGRSEAHCDLSRAYLARQHLFYDADAPQPDYHAVIEIALTDISPAMAGPVNPHQQVALHRVAHSFCETLSPGEGQRRWKHARYAEPVVNGAIAIAAITSCTTTANPRLIVQAALFARNVAKAGLMPKPWVKTSFSPGSRVVTDYLEQAGLLQALGDVGFHVTGYGCMTCIGSSGALQPAIEELVQEGLQAVCVLSGNRNFPRRVNPSIGHGYLTSPALVIAWSLLGNIQYDIARAPLGADRQGRPLYLSDLMPTDDDVQALVTQFVTREHYQRRRARVWQGTPHWQNIVAQGSTFFPWDASSTYLRRPGYLAGKARDPATPLTLNGARAFLWLGDDVTTDHISPAGAISAHSAAGQWLLEQGESIADLNLYSTRRSNHEVMIRGAFTHKAIINRLLPPAYQTQGGCAWESNLQHIAPVYVAAQSWRQENIPLVVLAGERYGAGSSRDWAAKAQALLGIKAVVARSFERIHRTNLIGMGIVPLLFLPGEADRLPALDGSEQLDFAGLDTLSVDNTSVVMTVSRTGLPIATLALQAAIDSSQELRYLLHGGILPYVIHQTVHAA